MDITIKNNLRRLRTANGLTQDELTEALNKKIKEIGKGEKTVSKMTISNWENNKHAIKSDKAELLANYFGVSVSYLLGYSEYENNEEVKNLIYDTPNGGVVAGEAFDWIAQLIGEKRMKRFLENTYSNDFIHYTFVDNEHNLRHTKESELLIFFSLLDNNDKQLIFDLVKSLSEKINSEEFEGYPLSKRLELQSKDSIDTNP